MKEHLAVKRGGFAAHTNKIIDRDRERETYGNK